MKLTFRWYGEKDNIPLKYIRQIPNMSGVVTAIYDLPVGEVWAPERILRLKALCAAQGLGMEVIESVPVHEDIKLGKPSRDKYIANYAETLRNLGRAGVKCVCYNFMPVFDWLRTDLKTPARDGSNSLSYRHDELLALDPKNLHLPGWDESYSSEELNGLLGEYAKVSHEALFENLVYFLNGILPACEEAGIDMAIHPDDPPWDMFGLPRIITGAESYEKLFAAVPDPHNGMTFCTGSLGAGRENSLAEIAEKYADRIFFAAGNLDLAEIVRALVRKGFDGYVRPDHGRNIWDEDGKPGYGLFDRALGAAYLNGLFEMAEKEEER